MNRTCRKCLCCGATFPEDQAACPLCQVQLGPPQLLDDPDGSLQTLGSKLERFTLQALLGRGGRGAVYLAVHPIGNLSAIKLLTRGDPITFRAEARALARLDHDHIVKFLDYSDEGARPYLRMELIRGRSLRQVCLDNPKRRLAPARAIDIALQIARALAYIHAQDSDGKKLIHQDLKPENVLLTQRNAQVDVVKLTDFGIGVMRTPHFCAPEGFVDRPLGPPYDIYALGCLLYDIIAGSPPFEGTVEQLWHGHLFRPPPSLSQSLPSEERIPGLAELVARLLDKREAERPTALEVVATLQEMLAARPPRSARSELLARSTLHLARDRAAQTVLLPERLHKLDQMEHDAAQVSKALEEKIEEGRQAWSLGWPWGKRWPWRKRWPVVLAALHQDYQASQQACLEMQYGWALMKHDKEQKIRALKKRSQAVRVKMLLLTERRNRGEVVEDRAFDELERALLALDLERAQPADPVMLLEEIARQEEEQRQMLLRLIDAWLARPWPGALRGMRTQVEALYRQAIDLNKILEEKT